MSLNKEIETDGLRKNILLKQSINEMRTLFVLIILKGIKV